MDSEQFAAALARDGYTEIGTRTQAPSLENGAHSHPFDVRALMLAGEMTLAHQGRVQVCRTGDVFSMQAGCEHTERFGPEGATYLVGRRPVKQAAA